MAAVEHHWYIGEGVDRAAVVAGAERAADRTGEPQTVHEHAHGTSCAHATHVLVGAPEVPY